MKSGRVVATTRPHDNARFLHQATCLPDTDNNENCYRQGREVTQRKTLSDPSRSLRPWRQQFSGQKNRLPYMTRAAAIIIDQECVALIQRDRAGQRYFVFPGGQVEASETIEEAAVREVAEELGVSVSLTALVAVVAFRGQSQYYYRAQLTGGTFGSGHGPEMVGADEAAGHYTPCWIKVADLPQLVVYPQAVAALVVNAHKTGWPAAPVYLDEP